MDAVLAPPRRARSRLSASDHRRVKIPDEVIEHPELEAIDSEYSPECLVEPEFIKDTTEIGQK